ncbi:hypothetical protein [Jiangella rhizosphaerae]|uniref:Uncharacterized protein n=1 Tax=Jiangella rhizosphaerae TaxID=2293569 RepID=A0A418KGI5_9ACTN|nr:hypothetical protein [Jiangella rhizosphaerae]RIQ11124.1 hypothetical protein DY240_29885 [Jiangella rhizosphaerae]
MNGQPVLFGVLPFRTSEAAYSFLCPACGRTSSSQPDTVCDACTPTPPAKPKKSTRRRLRKSAVQ